MSSNSETKDKYSKRPKDSKFKQQKLRAWEPIIRPKFTVFICLSFGILCILIGALCYGASQSLYEQVIDYTDDCTILQQYCNINFTIPYAINPPINFYYQLTGFYQNHRSYYKSRDDHQLRGDYISSTSAISDCVPLISVNNSNNISLAYFPCGLSAKNRFNDTFTLNYNVNSTTLMYINWMKTGIAWSTDLYNRFNSPQPNQPGYDVLENFNLTIDEDFMVWMHAAPFPNFRKLYRYMNNGLSAGNYTLNITNYFNVYAFNGRKAFVISTTNWFGGKDDFVGFAYLIVGILCLILASLFALQCWISPRKIGDPKNLPWKS